MSAKLLYSLSDENRNQNQNLKKQIGCMNGLLQFFDPHHFINNRSILSTPTHRRVPSDENKQQGRTVNKASKKSKEKHSNVVKDKQLSPIESSRFSVSSSTSTTISSSEYDWAPRPEHSPFTEPICNESRPSCNLRVHQPHSSPYQPSSPAKMSHYFRKKNIQETPSTCASPIKPAPREVAIYELRYMDSPRLQYSSRPDSPRLSAHNESFHSVSSNHSASVMTPTNDLSRLSYDERETRNPNMSTLKLRDLPRLSLDSKQRTKDSVHVSKDDLLLRNLKRENAPQEPASCRTPSNIVAKLMGLEEIPDYKPSREDQREHVESHIMRSPDMYSRYSRGLDGSKVDHVLHSPRSKSKESRASQLNKAKSRQQEAESDSIKHPLTIYGAIEKRLADLDFQKSGKDLRALKQILESMHREKNKLENRTENQSSRHTSQKIDSSSIHITQKQGPTKATPSKVKGIKSSREANPSQVVRDPRKEGTHIVEAIPTARSPRLRIVQPIDGTKASVQKKTENSNKESHHIINKYSREKTPRSIRTSKPPESMTKASLTSSARISDLRSSRVKHISSQNQNLARNTSILPESNVLPSEFSNDSTRLNQQKNPNLLMSQEQVHDKKNQEGTQGGMAFGELTIAVKEQPSPVSVLDASFYDDESPSPVKKKSTAFRDYKTNATYTEAEWKGTNPSYFADSIRTDFSYENEDYQKLESAPPVLKLSTFQRGNIRNNTPNYDEVNLEKSYIFEILLASGILEDLDHKDNHLVQQSEVINPKLFYELEQTRGSSFLPDNRGRHRRRLLFDAVNEILSEKLTQPRPLLKKQSGLIAQGPRFPQEIFKEINQLQPICTVHLEDEEDFLVTIIEKDLTHRSANWTNFNPEIPALVLDIERLIFKDLIVELVQDNTEVQVQKQSKQ